MTLFNEETRMNDPWIVSDTHFGHANMYKFVDKNGKPARRWDNYEEADEYMVERWNDVVGKFDRVYHLGDVVINRRFLPILNRLNGRKILIKGNHDIFKLKDYSQYFDDIRATQKLDVFIMSHIPIHPDSIPHWCSGNIHGHMHGNILPDKRYFNASVEQIKYTPITLSEIKRVMRER